MINSALVASDKKVTSANVVDGDHLAVNNGKE
jgi:hypothetical protein